MGPVRMVSGLGFFRMEARINCVLHPVNGEDYIEWSQLRCQWNARGQDGATRPLGTGRIWPDRLITEVETREPSLDVSIDFDLGRMAALENLRAGGDVHFTVLLEGWASQGTNLPQQYWLNAEVTVPRSEWLKRLEESGYKKTLLLEIPVPEVPANEALSPAARHLEMAQKHLLSGHYRDCVGACRDVVSAIDFIEFSADKDRDLRSVTEGIQRKASDLRSKDERIYLLRHSFKQIAHAARHDDRLPAENESSEGGEKALPFSWEPEDARLAFSIAAALYRYAYEMKGGRNGG